MLSDSLLRLGKQVVLCCFILVSLETAGFSQPAITLSSSVAPPTSNVLVSGTGFPSGGEVDIYFDTTDLALAVADDSGSFFSIPIKVPASAVPGKHWVTTKARITGEG